MPTLLTLAHVTFFTVGFKFRQMAGVWHEVGATSTCFNICKKYIYLNSLFFWTCRLRLIGDILIKLCWCQEENVSKMCSVQTCFLHSLLNSSLYLIYIMQPSALIWIKTYISNLVRKTYFWSNLHWGFRYTHGQKIGKPNSINVFPVCKQEYI